MAEWKLWTKYVSTKRLALLLGCSETWRVLHNRVMLLMLDILLDQHFCLKEAISPQTCSTVVHIGWMPPNEQHHHPRWVPRGESISFYHHKHYDYTVAQIFNFSADSYQPSEEPPSGLLWPLMSRLRCNQSLRRHLLIQRMWHWILCWPHLNRQRSHQCLLWPLQSHPRCRQRLILCSHWNPERARWKRRWWVPKVPMEMKRTCLR